MTGAFGSLVHEKRTSLAITMPELARRSGLSVSYISRIEHGQRMTFSRATVQALAKALALLAPDLDRVLLESFTGKPWAASRSKAD